MVVVWTLVTAFWSHPNGDLTVHWRQTFHQRLKMEMEMEMAMEPGRHGHLLFSVTCDG